MTRLLVVDIETGGLDPTTQSILSLGAVVWDDCVLGATFEVYICEPIINVETKAMKINKIDLAWLRKHGKSPGDAVKSFHEFSSENLDLGRDEKVTIAGHNIGFDVEFIRRLYRLAGVDYENHISHRTLDTASVLRYLTLAGAIPSTVYSSGSAFDYFDIPIEARDRHTALGDAIATAQLLTKLIEMARRQIVSTATL